MSTQPSDALVFLGATGDLAYKKVFPALQRMVQRRGLHVPVIGVAKAGWGLDQLRERARESLAAHGGLDPQAFESGGRAPCTITLRSPMGFGTRPAMILTSMLWRCSIARGDPCAHTLRARHSGRPASALYWPACWTNTDWALCEPM